MAENKISDTEQVRNTVGSALNAIDLLDWPEYRKCFCEGEIIFDYTSLNGGEPYTGDVDAFIQLVTQTLPGYKATSHQTYNPVVTLLDEQTAIFRSGIKATHYLPNTEFDSDAWQAVGFYEIQLVKNASHVWKIKKLKFTKSIVTGDCVGLRELAKKSSGHSQKPRHLDSEKYTY